MRPFTSSATDPTHLHPSTQTLKNIVATALGSLDENGILSTREGVLAYNELDDDWRAIIFEAARKIAGVSPS